MRAGPFLFAALALAACVDRGEVDELLGPETPGLEPVSLQPLEVFDGLAARSLEEEEEANAALEARANALRARTGAPTP